jgi:hypothetical protein
MFHYGKKSINNIYEDITNVGLLQNQIKTYPEPVTNLNISINDIEYSDDFEVSILRLLHIIFGKFNTIDTTRLKDNRNEVSLFLTKNNKIRNYISIRQRIEWCNLLNNRPFFQYKYQNKYKLQPTLKNLHTFFKVFFPSVQMKELINFESYNSGYYTSDKIYEETIIKLYLDGNNLYDWKIYQYYENLNNCKGKLITGFSELKYSIYLDKFYN